MGPGGRQFDPARPDQDSYLNTAYIPSLSLNYQQSGKQNGKQLLEAFIAERKGTRGLTPRGEEWLRDTLTCFLNWLTISIDQVRKEHIITFLTQYEDRPWRKRSMYLGLRTFWRWVSSNYSLPNPFIDRFGNPTILPPKTPDKVLYTMQPEWVQTLTEATESLRNKTIISLLADSGGRRNEIVEIQVQDVDLERRRIKVLGKGNKEGYLVFGEATMKLLSQYMNEEKPQGNLFDLNKWGVQSMLRRLGQKTGIHCNAHSFRRGFATELRRKGLNELDITQLGRWSDVSMVKRYTKAYTFEDAAKRYISIVA